MKRLIYFWCAIVVLFMAACGDSGEFRVAGEIAGMGTQNLRIFYYADGAVHSVTSAALDGKFRFAGQSKNPAVVEIFSSNRTFIGRVIVKNGEELDCRFDKDNRYNVSISGNETSSQWGKFLTENAGILASANDSVVNALIAGYVAKHRDNLLSTVLLLTEYRVPDYELTADSLLSMISSESRPDYIVDGFRMQVAALASDAARGDLFPMNLYCYGDSMSCFNPLLSKLSVLYFSSGDDGMRDSVTSMFRSWHDVYEPEQVAVLDISMEIDTASWHRSVVKENALWRQCWIPGAVVARPIARLAIPRTPYFIVADSLGHQLYRGMSLDSVCSVVNVRIAN